MRILLIALLVLTACDASTEAQHGDIRGMLRDGDTRVCVDSDVQLQVTDLLRKAAGANVLTLVSDEDFKKFVDGGKRIEFQAVSATGMNKDISEVSCSGNVKGEMGESSVEWKVRPQLDNEAGFIVELPEQPDRGTALAVVLAIRKALKNEEPKSTEQPPEAQATTESETADPDNAPMSTYEDTTADMNADESTEMNATNTYDQ